MKPSTYASFWEHVRRAEPEKCWPWLGGTNGRDRGYGQLRLPNGDRVLAHRIAWILTHGPVPEGEGVLHHCDTPLCCNPAHLFLGDQGVNMRDAAQKGRAGRPRRGPRGPNRLRDLRAERGLTLTRLAEVAGVAVGTIHYAERGARWPQPVTQHKIARALGVPRDVVFPEPEEAVS